MRIGTLTVAAKPLPGTAKMGGRIQAAPISSLSELTDTVTLKKDGGRISLEGVLTGAAFGLVFLYMLDSGMQALAGQGRRPTGPVGLGDDGNLGPFRTSAGKIPIAPLGEVEVGPAGRPAQAPEIGSPTLAAPDGGSGGGFAPPRLPSGLELGPSPNYGGLGSSDGLQLRSPSFPSLTANPLPPGSRAIIPGTPLPPDFEPPPGTVVPTDLPQLLLVLVRVNSQSNARSVEGKAISESITNQHGVNDSRIDMRLQSIPGFEIRSELVLPGSAYSQLSDADLRVIAEDVSLLNSTVLAGEANDVLVIGVQDLLPLLVATPTQGEARVTTRSTGIQGSTVDLGAGSNVLDVEALQRLSFTALGMAQKAQLSFSLLTEGLKQSWIRMGGGNDSLLINSGWYGGVLPVESPVFFRRQDLGISLDLSELANPQKGVETQRVSLNASAIGLDQSIINLGDGNNTMAVNTRIDQDLERQLGVLSSDASTTVLLDRIGMRDSTITMGKGDDSLIINGRILNSTIDLGAGRNQLFLETAPDDQSTLVTGSGSNQIVIDRLVGTTLRAGPGDDSLQLTDARAYGSFDGGGGSNSLIGGSGEFSNRDVITVTGPDQGYFNAFHFDNVGTLDAGANNDVVIMELSGSLTGQLLGGSGLDRLEFHNWNLPLQVDLDRGEATAIYGGKAGGLRGFEQVLGGNANDLMISSGAFHGIDGGLGEDVMYLRWSPWLSSPAGGLQVNGGSGNDLFVFAGLDTPLPSTWDGTSGLPTLSDFDLSVDNSRGIGLTTDRIGVVSNSITGNGSPSQLFTELTPSGPSGVGNSKLLPIAPIGQLLSGMSDSTRQLAISYDPLSTERPEMVLLGMHGKGTFGNVAHLNIARIEAPPT
jgi:hypothetical protein